LLKHPLAAILNLSVFIIAVLGLPTHEAKKTSKLLYIIITSIDSL